MTNPSTSQAIAAADALNRARQRLAAAVERLEQAARDTRARPAAANRSDLAEGERAALAGHVDSAIAGLRTVLDE